MWLLQGAEVHNQTDLQARARREGRASTKHVPWHLGQVAILSQAIQTTKETHIVRSLTYIVESLERLIFV